MKNTNTNIAKTYKTASVSSAIVFNLPINILGILGVIIIISLLGIILVG